MEGQSWWSTVLRTENVACVSVQRPQQKAPGHYSQVVQLVGSHPNVSTGDPALLLVLPVFFWEV